MANCSMCTPDAQGSYICNDCIKIMKSILRKIAYPRRGTNEQDIDIYEAAMIIQAKFSLDRFDDVKE